MLWRPNLLCIESLALHLSKMARDTDTAGKQPYFGLTGKWLTYWITFACSVDMLMFGYDQAVFSGVIVTDDFLILHDLVGPEKTTVLSTITAIYDVGCFLGAIVAFTIGERLGRKMSIIAGTAIMSIGAILMTSSFSLEQMFVGRIILGYVKIFIFFKKKNSFLLSFFNSFLLLFFPFQ